MDSRWQRQVLAVALVLGASVGGACGGDSPGGADGGTPSTPTSVAPVEVAAISTELATGECAGYCRRQTDLTADLQGRYRELPFREDTMYPPQERSFTLTAREWTDVAALASAATRQTWEASYGCPDCGDQGAWRLTVRSPNGEERTTVLDAFLDKNPEPLRRVIQAVRALDASTRGAP